MPSTLFVSASGSPWRRFPSSASPRHRRACSVRRNLIDDEDRTKVDAPSTVDIPPTGKPDSAITTTAASVSQDLCPVTISDDVRKEIYRNRSFIELTLGRGRSTAEDIAMHFDRKFFKKKEDLLNTTNPRVVVLGTGWGAHAFAKVIDNYKYDVAVVSPRNYFCFTPMLASSAVGTVEFRSIVEPIRTSNELLEYFEASAYDVVPDRKVVLCESERFTEGGKKKKFELPYDYLCVAVGATTNTFGTPGVKEHCFFLKDIADARDLRRSIIDRFEKANLPETAVPERNRLLHFVVVGGGPTGCEFAAELRDFLKGDLSNYYPKLIKFVKVSLIQSAFSILLQFDAALQSSAIATFKKTGIDLIVGARVIDVSETVITLKDGRTVEYGLAVWAAGNGTRPLVKSLIGQVDEQTDPRQIMVDRWLRVIGCPDIYALGDCSVMPNPLPATAQVAGQQGAYLARLLNKRFSTQCEIPVFAGYVEGELIDTPRKVAPPFNYLALGILAYIGSNTAVAQIETGRTKINLTGLLAFLGWRSVYLTKQVSTRNRVLVLFDWFKTQLFGRDISQF